MSMKRRLRIALVTTSQRIVLGVDRTSESSERRERVAHLILIVEDEADLRATLEYNLEHDGFQTRAASDGATGLELATKRPLPDLILLDLMLPDISGKDVCREIRSNPDTRHIPIIMATAKGEEVDRVIGFEVGADDYVVKPFSMRELLLRIRAILKRAGEPRTEVASTFGMLRIDPEAHAVWISEQPVSLTVLEFKLLMTLFSRKGRIQSRRQLLRDVWDIDVEVETRTVDTHVKRLRQKLGDAGRYIETLRGAGYRFVTEP
jgi:two-component system phosphate regulon response regulator PhoB